jgi:hypothetical protein
VIFKHYRELATEADADAWFGILPKEEQAQNTFKLDRKKGRMTLNGIVVK